MRSPKLVPLLLTGAEREALEALVRKRTASQALALRARIVLACAHGRENKVVAAQLRTSEHNMTRWRGRFIAGRLGGCTRRSGPGGRRRSCWTRSRRS